MSRPRFNRKSDINEPTICHTVKQMSLSLEQTQIFLDDFIAKCDNLQNINPTGESIIGGITGSSYFGPSGPTVSQLKRLQRSLRGLPPLLVASQPFGSKPAGTISTPKVNTKIVFDDVPKSNSKGDADDEDNEFPAYGDDDDDDDDDALPAYSKDDNEEDNTKDADVSLVSKTIDSLAEESDKKRKFDEVASEADTSSTKIDKEERKRLKKERRRAEKEAKKTKVDQ
ncbi:unnamed protein product [Ambrosiozyma monospora]|uniref:Unnamed protein product n=1 Tax=Ambrosiozyma monospora TaxID=43982 RepID=A0A9W6YUX5_AMBMO|nr:unnamed protein product [Ambrosiozyma monospora]